MKTSETVEIARDLTGYQDLRVPVSWRDAVRTMVGDDWRYSAGTVDLSPAKSFERTVFLRNVDRSVFFGRTYGTSFFIPEEFGTCFEDDGIDTRYKGKKENMHGLITVEQRPKDDTVEQLAITVADVGKMMLANEVLHEQGLSFYRGFFISEVAEQFLDFASSNKD